MKEGNLMGLDMYLHAKKYVEKVNWQALQNNDELSYDSPEAVFPLWNNIVETAGMKDVAVDIYGVHVEVTCAYWRKANQIHAWFVNNPNLLPPQDGFFFGSTDIDEWYWKDLKNTKAKLDKVFALPEMSKLSFYYTSSW